MPFFNGSKPFPGQDQNPLVRSVFVRVVDDQGLTPPPDSLFLITQNGLFITAQNGDLLITQPV